MTHSPTSPTNPATPAGERHCDHECVCWFAHGGMRPDGAFGNPCCIPCNHDTRIRPLAAQPLDAPEIIESVSLEQLKEISKLERESMKIIHNIVGKDKGDAQEILTTVGNIKQHDLAIATAAKAEVLGAVFNGVSCLVGSPEEANEEQCMKKECPLAITHVGHPEGNPLDTHVIFDGCLIESLRSTLTTPDTKDGERK